jgi:hypothetical protein
MSLAAIRNGLVATIIGAGKWSASQVSTCDFGIMNLSASCVVLQPGAGTQIEPLTLMGGDNVRGNRIVWEIAGMVLVKDPGNPLSLLSSMWTACDDIYASVHADDTLGGAAQVAGIVNISRPSMDSFITDGNVDWGYINFAVRAEEFLA